jgi:hypothetical protein
MPKSGGIALPAIGAILMVARSEALWSSYGRVRSNRE